MKKQIKTIILGLIISLLNSSIFATSAPRALFKEETSYYSCTNNAVSEEAKIYFNIKSTLEKLFFNPIGTDKLVSYIRSQQAIIEYRNDPSEKTADRTVTADEYSIKENEITGKYEFIADLDINHKPLQLKLFNCELKHRFVVGPDHR